MPVQQGEHPQILRRTCGLLRPDHISEVSDDYLHLPHAYAMGFGQSMAQGLRGRLALGVEAIRQGSGKPRLVYPGARPASAAASTPVAASW